MAPALVKLIALAHTQAGYHAHQQLINMLCCAAMAYKGPARTCMVCMRTAQECGTCARAVQLFVNHTRYTFTLHCCAAGLSTTTLCTLSRSGQRCHSGCQRCTELRQASKVRPRHVTEILDGPEVQQCTSGPASAAVRYVVMQGAWSKVRSCAWPDKINSQSQRGSWCTTQLLGIKKVVVQGPVRLLGMCTSCCGW
jgi:hypothetical protein